MKNTNTYIDAYVDKKGDVIYITVKNGEVVYRGRSAQHAIYWADRED